MSSPAGVNPVELAKAKFDEHAYQDVIDLLEPVLREQPMHAHALHLYSGALIQMKRFEDAVPPALKLAVVEPNIPEARYYAGLALSNANRHREAIEHFEAVLHMRPSYLDTVPLLGKSLYLYAQSLEASEPKTAELNYRRAGEVMPDRPEPVVALIRLIQQHGSKGDLAFYITQLPHGMKEHASIKPMIEAIDQDPDVHNLLHEPDATPHSVDDPRGGVRILSERDLAMQNSGRFDPAPTFMTSGGVTLLCGAAAAAIGVMVMNGGMANATVLGGVLIAAGVVQVVIALMLLQKGSTL